MELLSPQELDAVAIEKGLFGFPSTKVAFFTYKGYQQMHLDIKNIKKIKK